MVAGAGVRRRSRQPVSRPKTVQFSLTVEEFESVSRAAAQAGLARGAYAAAARPAAAAAEFPLPLAGVLAAAVWAESAEQRSKPQVAKPPARARPTR